MIRISIEALHAKQRMPGKLGEDSRPKNLISNGFGWPAPSLKVAGLVLLLCGHALSQTQTPILPTWPQLADRGIVAGRTFDVGGIENIGVESGNLMLHIPLASLPAGPGGSSFSVGLVYNSQIFDLQLGSQICDNVHCAIPTNIVSSTTGGGWNYSWHYWLNDEEKSFPYSLDCNSNADQFKYSHRLSMVFPDGSQHLLNAKGYHSDNSGYFEVSPVGFVSTGCGTSPVTGTLVYYTDDGTFSRLEYTITDTSWVFYRPDGSRVVGKGLTNSQVEQIIDRNGNTITITPAVVNGVPTATISDSLGRQITLSNTLTPSAQGVDIVSGPGANGTPLYWTVTWGTTSGGYQLSYYCVDGMPSSLCESASPITSGVSQILLPAADNATQLTYTFQYNSNNTDRGRGELKQMTMPYGETVSYSYQYKAADTIETWTPQALMNSVVAKTSTYLDSTGVSRTDSWAYGAWSFGTVPSKFVTYPDGGTKTYYHYALSGDPGITSYRVGAIVEQYGSQIYSRTDRIWRKNCPIQIFSNQAGNPYIKAEFRTVFSSSGTATGTSSTIYSYDRNGNMLSQNAYDFGQAISTATNPIAFPAPGPTANSTLIRSVSNTYARTPGSSLDGDQTKGCGDSSINNVNSTDAYWNVSPTAPKLDSLLKSDITGATGVGTPAHVENTYDNPLTTGNLTVARQWDSTSATPYSSPMSDSNSIKTLFSYDAGGNVTSITDPNGIATGYSFNKCYGRVGSYPTSVTRAGMTISQDWDCSSGLMTSLTDVNGIVRSRIYDSLGRASEIVEAVGKPTERHMAMGYSESSTSSNSPLPLSVSSGADRDSVLDQQMTSTRQMDQRGQTALSTGPDGATTQHITALASSGFTYDATSNPHVGGTISGWTRTKRDILGRVVEVAHFNGAALPSPWGSNLDAMGTVTTFYDGATTTISDETGATRKLTMDAAGRLIKVVEDPSVNNYTTTYAYDFRGNLMQVTHANGLPRSFAYSSLGRLTTATNPESGTINYIYDYNGNLLQKGDGRGIYTTFGFDNLNRLGAKQYSDSTPPVTYCYDGDTSTNHGFTRGRPNIFVPWSCAGAPTGGNMLGRLTMVRSGAVPNDVTTQYFFFDEMGRAGLSTQTINNGQPTDPYEFVYQYNLAGTVKSMQYPSGRTVNYGVDNASRPVSVQSQGGTNYVTGVTYAPHGPIGSITMQSGTEFTSFNSRLQPNITNFVKTTGSLQLLVLINSHCPTANSADKCTNNNGNVYSQTITYSSLLDSNSTNPRVQTFTYDGLNRLSTAVETQTGASGWTQNFGYDSAGNRWVTNGSFVISGNPTPQASGAFDAATNRLNILSAHYDNAGNQDQIGGYARTYDAENRMVSSTVNSTVSTYRYDGDGRRVQRTVGASAPTTYVYDAFGKLASEYGYNPYPNCIAQPTAQPAALPCYVVQDSLGSTRLLVDAGGNPLAAHDYLPFGEEIPAGTTGRGGLYASGVEVNQKFTGKERDAETGLDYFGARYFSGAQGRFTSPDAPFADQHVIDPQSWNMYVYVRNNPLKNTDPDGRDCFQGFSSCANYLFGGAKAVANLVPAAATLVNRVVTGGLVGDAPMFQPSNVDQAQGMHAANVMMLVSPLAEAGAAAAVEAIGTGARVEAAVPLITQNAARGAASEARVLNDMGLTKNTTPISGTAGRSIPDINTSGMVGDVKDVKVVSNTPQMRIQREVAGQTGRDHVIVTGTNTHVTAPAQRPPTRIIRRDDLGPQE